MRWPWQHETQDRPGLTLVVDGTAHSVAELRAHAQNIANGNEWLTQTERGIAISLVAALDELVHVCGEPTKWECWRCGATQVRNGLRW